MDDNKGPEISQRLHRLEIGMASLQSTTIAESGNFKDYKHSMHAAMTEVKSDIKQVKCALAKVQRLIYIAVGAILVIQYVFTHGLVK